MRVVWTYSKSFKKGVLNNVAEHKYIQWLFRKSILTSPSYYTKIIYTDAESKDVFSDIVDEVIIRDPKPFILLDDLKFEIVRKLKGEFLICDGDLFIDEPLNIPTNVDMAFEYKGLAESIILKWKNVLLDEGIVEKVPIWGLDNKSYWNLGLMYFNNDKAKNDLADEYFKTQQFYSKNIDPKYQYNKNNVMFSACAAQMLIEQFNLSYPYKIGDFKDSIYRHYGNQKKLDLYKEFYNIPKLL